MKNKHNEKYDYILHSALTTFLHYGFKKTSMDDIAKAAGITRQGLYFHFKNKDEILKASVKKALNDSMSAVDDALQSEDVSLEDKIYHALDAWYGSYVGLFGSDLSDWDFHCERVLGNDIVNSEAEFFQKLKAALCSAGNSHLEDTSIDTMIEVLCICGQTWKRTAESHEQFTVKMYQTIRLCCKNL